MTWHSALSPFISVSWSQLLRRFPTYYMARSQVVTLSERKPKMLHLIGNPPLLTLLIATVCILIFITQLKQAHLSSVCLLPSRLVSRLELYRIFTFPFFHVGFLHILFNMIAWISLANSFERSMGTFASIYTVFLLLIPLSALLHVFIAFILDALASTNFRNECAVGLSGLLFSVIVVNIQQSGVSSVSFFGFFNISSRWYPWVLAAILQLFAPNLSLLGHTSGIIMGYVLSYGYLTPITPSDYKLSDIEETFGLTDWPLWQPVPSLMSGMYSNSYSLPQNGTSQMSFSERCQAAWNHITSYFSRSGSLDGVTPSFRGQGRVLRGDTPMSSVACVPASSRLLQVNDTSVEIPLEEEQTSPPPIVTSSEGNDVHNEPPDNNIDPSQGK